MKRVCSHCSQHNLTVEIRSQLKRSGRFRRTSDGRKVQKFRCNVCRRESSSATNHPCYRQKKRQLNYRIMIQYCSGVSQRRIAKILGISRTTVARKVEFMGLRSLEKFRLENLCSQKAEVVEFDDLETFEHTKLKPLSITLAVEHRTRRILDFRVSQMPAKGHLAKLSRKKYGHRNDKRATGREELFNELKNLVSPTATFKSDQNPHYPSDVKAHFPKGIHETFKGQRGSIVGQGELKKIRFDPLFSLNHTCAMFRANINRLFRKTWCTTKLPEKLALHIAMYAHFHNSQLIKKI
jgi:transposase-like protein